MMTHAPKVKMAMVWTAAAAGSWALCSPLYAQQPSAQQAAPQSIVLHAAHLLEIDTGRLISPGEVLVDGERITAVGAAVPHPAGARLIDLGDSTLLPGLIDAHVHLFL